MNILGCKVEKIAPDQCGVVTQQRIIFEQFNQLCGDNTKEYPKDNCASCELDKK